MYRKTRKVMTIIKKLHSKTDTHRTYEARNRDGRGVVNEKDNLG